VHTGVAELTCRYGTPYHGQSGLQAGFLVAFTQLIPEHQIQLFGKLKIRVKVSCSKLPPGMYGSWADSPGTVHPDLERPHDRPGLVALHAHPIRLLRLMGVPPVLQAVRGWTEPGRQE